MKGTGGMDKVGKTAVTGGGGDPGVRLVLQGGDTGDPAVQVECMGTVRRDDEDCGGQPCGVIA